MSCFSVQSLHTLSFQLYLCWYNIMKSEYTLQSAQHPPKSVAAVNYPSDAFLFHRHHISLLPHIRPLVRQTGHSQLQQTLCMSACCSCVHDRYCWGETGLLLCCKEAMYVWPAISKDNWDFRSPLTPSTAPVAVESRKADVCSHPGATRIFQYRRMLRRSSPQPSLCRSVWLQTWSHLWYNR